MRVWLLYGLWNRDTDLAFMWFMNHLMDLSEHNLRYPEILGLVLMFPSEMAIDWAF